MQIKLTAFLAAWLTIASIVAFGQTGASLSGQVLGADGKPADAATVLLVQTRDSAVVKTALANVAGKYLFEGLKPGNYRIWVTLMGYQNYKSQSVIVEKQPLVMPVISLQHSGTLLKTVAITAQKQLIEHQPDRTVVNVDALIGNAGATALDVLEKSPGVIVDNNGAISLQGKNSVKIYIDDKPTYLSGADLENYLRSLSASTINQVELMTNPPAKYDAAGNGGIINIRTKRGKAKGFNGGLSMSYSQGKYGKTNNSANFNYRDSKINLFGNLSYSTGNNFNDLDINRYFENADGSLQSKFLQNSFIRRTSKTYNAKLGLDYYASAKTTWGLGLTGLLNPGDEHTINTSRLLNAQNTPDSTIVANNAEHRSFKNGGINLNYRHQYNTGGPELTADLDYLRYDNTLSQGFDNSSYLPNGTLINHDLLTGALPSAIDIYAAKTDYTLPLKSGLKLAGGLKTSYTQTDNIANYFYTVNQNTTPDYDKTNHFIYKENINAAYINASRDFKRLSVQLGLRFENTVSKGHQLGNVQKPDSVFKRNYNGLFPTVYLQYKLDTAGNQQISLNYGRRIDRPYYEDLNPFLAPLDKFTYYTGNPFLRPAYTQNIELSHTYKKITTTLSYSKTRDNVDETIEIVNGIYYSRPGNLGSTVVKGISVDASADPAKWLSLQLFATAVKIHTRSDFYNGPLDTKGTYYFVKPMLQFKLPRDWTAQLNGLYQSRVTSAQFVTGNMGKVNAALFKKLSASTTLKLVVNDIFYTNVNSGDINNLANTRADYHNLSDTRTAVLSLSYRFGKATANQRKHESTGAESEQNRVKN